MISDSNSESSRSVSFSYCNRNWYETLSPLLLYFCIVCGVFCFGGLSFFLVGCHMGMVCILWSIAVRALGTCDFLPLFFLYFPFLLHFFRVFSAHPGTGRRAESTVILKEMEQWDKGPFARVRLGIDSCNETRRREWTYGDPSIKRRVIKSNCLLLSEEETFLLP